MSKASRRFVGFAFLLVFLFPYGTASAQDKEVAPPAPVPSQLFTAKKAFISNGGLDGIAFQAFQKVGDVYQPYNTFYAAMKEWGKYALVFTPAEAELVFEIRFNAVLAGVEHLPIYAPQMKLIVYDAKTHFVLWTMLAPVQGAYRKQTFVRNVNQGIAALMAELRSMQSRPANSAAPSAP